MGVERGRHKGECEDKRRRKKKEGRGKNRELTRRGVKGYYLHSHKGKKTGWKRGFAPGEDKETKGKQQHRDNK